MRDELLAITQTGPYDVRAFVRRCYEYRFRSETVRLWQGEGLLHTADGRQWLGTIDANGRDLHQVPAIQDGRGGASPRYVFGLSAIDPETMERLKASQDEAAGATLVVYLALMRVGEGMRPGTPISFYADFSLKGVTFAEQARLDGASVVIDRAASVIARDGNEGRSEVPNGRYNDTYQRERSRQLGIDNDRGCEFVAGLANKTFDIP